MRCTRGVATPISALLLLAGLAASSAGRASGASPYLPLNLSPEIERKVEQVLLLAGRPVMRRPIPIERVLEALPKACTRDATLCAQVHHYLDRYFQTAGLMEGSIDLAAKVGDSTTTLPNQRGERVDSPWDASLLASYRPYEHVLLSAGGIGYGGADHRFNPDGTMVSLGDEYLQLDAGWRDQWLSPLTDSSMLISTNAPTMPSLTLSNQKPISPVGLDYELFLARMSYSDLIAWNGGYTAGDPKLFGLHLGIGPLPNWAIAGNVLYQFGGGARPDSLGELFSSLFQRTVNSSTSPAANDSRFGNRTVSMTSAYTYPGTTPFQASVEYAARDTLHGELYRWHQTALSAGLHFPELFQRFDLTLEVSEWQNDWYTDYVWQSGLTEDGNVIGNWGAGWRTFSNAAGARSATVQLGFALRSGDLVNVRYRALQNAGYDYYTNLTAEQIASLGPSHYVLAQMVTLEYAQPSNGYTRGLTLDAGRDEYSADFLRLAAFLRFDGGNQGGAAAQTALEDEDQGEDGSDHETAPLPAGLQHFVDAGVSGGRLGLNLGGFYTTEAPPLQYRSVSSPHLGLGVRGAVTTNSDLGVRAEFDDFKGLMLALRIADYRYRFGAHLAVGGFAGFARYSAPTPAQGLYYGAGLQWRNLWAHWDLSLDARFFNALQRDKVLPSDQNALKNGDPVEWYMMQAPSLYLSHAF